MAEKKGFDLAAVLGSVSNLDTGVSPGREQIEYIKLDLLDADPNNFYALDGIDELASNIELIGVQQPLRIRVNPEDPGRFIIVSGHRRHAAIRRLVKEGKTSFAEVPCIRERAESSAALQELRLIYANSDTRKMSPADISKQAERVEMLLYQLKEEGYEFPGRMRDHVAQACQISASKLARLKVIREGLAPEYKTQWDAGNLNEAAAYSLARLPQDFQQRVAKACKNVPNGGAIENVRVMYEDGHRWEPDITCPDGSACKHGNGFLKQALAWTWIDCKGDKCCMECRHGAKADYGVCPKMCAKASAARKDKKAAQDAKVEAQVRKQTKKYQRETTANAKRLLRAIDAAGLSDHDRIAWANYSSDAVSYIRKCADGVFPEDKRLYEALFKPERCYNVIALTKQLKCSADYLLGLSDELRPTAAKTEWLSKPEVRGAGVGFFAVEDSPAMVKLAYFDGEGFYFRKGGPVIDAACLAWCPVPGVWGDEEKEGLRNECLSDSGWN